jgi:hypothetical protein
MRAAKSSRIFVPAFFAEDMATAVHRASVICMWYVGKLLALDLGLELVMPARTNAREELEWLLV